MLEWINDIYSDNVAKMKKSVIRELLKLTQKPEIISFAGGLPSPLTFPKDEIAQMAKDVIISEGEWALQYATTEGMPVFKKEIRKFLKTDNVETENENIIVTTASQQGLDLIGRVFLNDGDTVIMGRPTYLGAISAFKGYRAHLTGVSLDDDGMIIDELEKKLEQLKKTGQKTKLIYTVPDFQNPAGVTLTLERRKKMIELARQYHVIIIEDSPYRSLRYAGESVPSLYELDNGVGTVVTLQTFSKILFPGLRLGWIMGHAQIIDKMVVAKQAMDLCTPPITQAIAYEYMRHGCLPGHISDNVTLYSKRRKVMLQALEDFMPKHPEVHWTKPEGGMFLWIRLPEHVDTEKMFEEAVEENVAYVIGSAFYPDGGGSNTMRLNFSYPTEEQIVTGVQRLARVISKNLK